MKKYLLGIIAIFLAICFTAFTVKEKKENNSIKTSYVWHKFNPAGTAELSPVVTFTGTSDEAKVAFACPDGASVNCARAYTMTGTPLSIYVKKTAE